MRKDVTMFRTPVYVYLYKYTSVYIYSATVYKYNNVYGLVSEEECTEVELSE